VNSLFIPWDFVLILILLGAILPWRGYTRMKRLLSKPDLTSADRLHLYGTTIFFQWTIVAVVAWRTLARAVSPADLGLTAGDPWQVIWTSLALTGFLCLNQVMGLRRIAKIPEAKRGRLLTITGKIMPRNVLETLSYAALCCTAGISEEFLYRGFVYMAFAKMVSHFSSPVTFAAILSSIWFSLAHVYQGKRGIITTLVVGMLFVGVRIWTGSLLPAVAAHIGIDLMIGLYAPRILQKA
jgi:uncharacterized protein